MKRLITLLISAVMILALCIPAFAAEAPAGDAKEYYPIVGSWKLNTVFNVVDGQEPEAMKEEEAQSYYGTGINILTFDEDGYAHDMLFAGPDTSDTAAEWKTTSPNVYVYTEEDGIEITFTYEEEKDVLHRYFEITGEGVESKKLDFVYARAVVGSWKLDQVLEIHEGDAPVEMKKEENQSLYAEAENVLTFAIDGKVEELVKEGGEETTQEGTWKMPEPDKYIYTIDTLETEMEYFRVDDTLFRNVKTEEGQPYFRFIYARTEITEKEDTEFDGGYAGYNYTAPEENTDERVIVDYKQDGTPVYSDDPSIIGYTEDGFPMYALPEGSHLGGDEEEDGPVIVDYKQDGTPVYSDDPSIVDFRQDGTPVYALPEGSHLGGDEEEEDAPVIVDYKQDGTPVYSDDPSIVDFRQDGTPVYEIPEGSVYYEEGEEPVIVDYKQDGTPVYSDDPSIVDFRQDGTPVYEIPEGSYLNDEEG